jgi:branched-chain amino acid transport system permease protein
VLWQQIVNGLSIGAIYALMAVGLTIIFGIMRVVNFAHGEFYMLGAYFVWMATAAHLGYLVGLPVAIISVMIVGALFEMTVLRRLRDASVTIVMMSTIALWILTQNAALLIWGPVAKTIPTPFGNDPLVLGSAQILPHRLVTAAAAIGLILLTRGYFQYSRFGRAMRATYQDREIAAAFGIDVRKVNTATFMIGTGLAGAAGALIGPIFLATPVMGDFPALKSFAVVILGGLGNFLGAIVGGLLLGVIEALAAGYVSSQYQDAIAFAMVIIVLIVKPRGLFGDERL